MPAAMPVRGARVRDSKRMLWGASPHTDLPANPSIRRSARPRAESECEHHVCVRDGGGAQAGEGGVMEVRTTLIANPA